MTSVWLDETAADEYPPLGGDVDVDVAIIGAGVAGIATAYHLASAGARVAIVEARTVAEAASGRNAGFLLAGVAENFVAASRRYGDTNALRIWRFTRHNQELVRALVERHRIDCDLAWRGSAQAAGDEVEWSEVRDGAARLAREGVRVRIVATERSAIYEDDGEFHPVRYVRGNFVYGRSFLHDADLDDQRQQWLERIANVRVHATTHERPRDRFDREERFLLQPLAPRRYTSLVLERASTSSAPRRPPRPVVAVEKRSLSAYARLAGGAA